MASSYIGIVQPNGLGGKGTGIPSGVNLDDSTFSDLLEKQMNTESSDNNWLSLMCTQPVQGIQNNGFDIQDLINSSNKIQNDVQNFDINKDEDITTSEMLTFLSSPFDTHNHKNHLNHDFLDFAKKQAANFYNKCASNVITDLTEFVEDTLKLS